MPLLHDDKSIGEIAKFLDRLVNQENGKSHVLQRGHHGPNLFANQRREPLRGFIKQEKAWVCGQGPADGQHLLFATRKVVGFCSRLSRKAWEQPVDLHG